MGLFFVYVALMTMVVVIVIADNCNGDGSSGDRDGGGGEYSYALICPYPLTFKSAHQGFRCSTGESCVRDKAALVRE